MTIAARRPTLADRTQPLPASLAPLSLTTPAQPAPTLRWMSVVRDAPADPGPGGIWADDLFAAEARELTTLLGGLARLEAEILSL